MLAIAASGKIKSQDLIVTESKRCTKGSMECSGGGNKTQPEVMSLSYCDKYTSRCHQPTNCVVKDHSMAAWHGVVS